MAELASAIVAMPARIESVFIIISINWLVVRGVKLHGRRLVWDDHWLMECRRFADGRCAARSRLLRLAGSGRPSPRSIEMPALRIRPQARRAARPTLSPGCPAAAAASSPGGRAVRVLHQQVAGEAHEGHSNGSQGGREENCDWTNVLSAANRLTGATQASLGRCWERPFVSGLTPAIYMIGNAFPESVTGLRNDGVNGSSPLSGTIATKGHAGVHGPFWQSTHTN